MPLDYNILNNSKSLLDQTQMQQDFALRKQAAIMDAATKANALKYQLIAAGAANGADGLAQVKNKLGQMGIDASEYSDDPTQAAQQALAAQQATSPYGTLYNAALKDQSNQIALSGITGQLTPGALRPSLPSPAQVAPQPVPQQPIAQSIAQPASQTIAQPALARPQAANSIAVPQINDKIDAAPPAPPAMPNFQLNQGGFQFRPQNPTETAAKYNQERQAALEEYKLNNAAQIEQDKAKAGELGKGQGAAVVDAAKASTGYDNVVQTLEGIKKLAPYLPEQKNVIQTPGAQAWWSQNFGNNQMANDYGAFTKLNEAQTIGAIRNLADTGQIRMTRTLENIINRGYLVDPGLNAEGKIREANAIQAELRNASAGAQNVSSALNGGASVPYSDPLGNPSPSLKGPANVPNPIQQSFDNKKAVASGIPEGTMAINPQTGHKIIFKGGKWQDR